MGELHLDDITIGYRNETVIRGLSLHVPEGRLVSLLGPSGAGKTTILRAVAGLISLQAGEIRIDGQPVQHIPPERRNAVLVFQKPLLFPFLNVAQNVAFGMRMQGPIGTTQRRRIEEILELVQLQGLARRRVHELSGGQQQRVSLARALVLKPAILLLDEPLSNLDASLRQQMRELIQTIQAETRITTLFVTHDQSEALMISHRVALLLDGRLRQVGSPHQLFYRPADPEVARFFGGENFFTGDYQDGRFVSALGEFPVAAQEVQERQLTATIRPEDVAISPNGQPGLPGRVVRTNFEGTTTRVWIDCEAGRFVVLTSDTGYTPGQEVRLQLPPEKVRVFGERGAEGGERGE